MLHCVTYPISRKSTKALIRAYEDAEEQWKNPLITSVLEELHEETESESTSEPEPNKQIDSAQRTCSDSSCGSRDIIRLNPRQSPRGA